MSPRIRGGFFVAMVLVTSGMVASRARAADRVDEAARVISPSVITSFEQIWQMPEAEAKVWHRIRMEYSVYYYDPLWQAMWGRSGKDDSYLSIGNKPFPIRPGQRILVEGLIMPVKGLNVDEPKVTILAESAPVEILPTRGEIGNTQKFNKRLVTAEGYVNRQAARDANHQEFELVVEGRPVLVQFLVKNEELAPQVNGARVRVKGVYFARNEPTWTAPKLEIWVQGIQDIEVLGQLARDDGFALAATPIAELADAVPDKLARITGAVLAQQPGKSLTIRDASGETTLPTAQTQPMEEGARVEAIGFPMQQGGKWSLSQALYRRELGLITTLNELLNPPEAQRNAVHRVEVDFTVYYYDPEWKVLWGRWGKEDTFLMLGDYSTALKAGQKIRIIGLAVPAKGLRVDEAKITVLAEGWPIAAVATRGQVGRTETFDKRMAVVEGYVDRQFQNDPRHLELNLVTEGRAVTVWVLLTERTPVPKLEGVLIEATGVYSATSDPLGGPPKIEVWTPSLKDIVTKGTLAQDAQFNLPPTAVENLASAASDGLVRVAGIVRMQQPGKTLTIRDETGQVTLLTAQSQPLPLGAQVEAIGYAALQGTEWQLRSSLYRRSSNAPPASVIVPTSVLRLAEQVRELSPEEAARGHPVRLNGIVTWANRSVDFFFVNDTSGGVCVIQPAVRNDKIATGIKVTINGVSAPGKFTPVVLATSLSTTAAMEPPAAKEVTLEQALTGIEDSQWISMRGYIRTVAHQGQWGRLALTTGAGDFTAQLNWNEQLAGLGGSVVQLHGVCSVLTNAKRQLIGIHLWVPSTQYIAIEEAAPGDPFAIPMRSLASLRQYTSLIAINRRVRVTGSMVHQIPGEVLHLQEGSESVVVLSHDPLPLVPGDRIEAVGFPGREGSRVVLREATYRRLAAGPEPAPVEIAGVDPIDVDLDGKLVRIGATVLDPGTQAGSGRLVLQARGLIFEALLERDKNAPPGDLTAGSRVTLTGVYQVEFDAYRRPQAVRVLLRSAQDIQILSRPPWFTAARALAAIGVLLAGLVLGFGWVVGLRRRVHQQTGLIREQVESEKAARLEVALARASKLESLGVLAGGIAHDFNNLLTVVMGNLSLAKLDSHIGAETMECLRESENAALRARDLTQQLITFAKGGEPVRAVTLLPGVVREATQFALHGSKVRCEYDFAADVWPADVDKGQVGQAIQNIILNSIHAMPGGGVIRIALRNEEVTTGVRPAMVPGRYLRLTIADTGTGIAPQHLPRMFEPYFTTKAKGSGLGLATVYSIIKKHQGHIEVESKLGEGTKFHLWLPSVAETSAVAVEAKPPTQTARVLFMDDEAPIRMLAGAIFKRMGYDYTAALNGDEVLHEYAAARSAGRPYDLVMLDLTVPGGMGGAEAMEKLRQMDPDVRAIVSSGYSSDPVMANYRDHGFQAMVTKPYEMAVLVKTINDVLAHRANHSKPEGGGRRG